MKNLLITLFTFISFCGYSQTHTILLYNGRQVNVDVIREDKKKVIYRTSDGKEKELRKVHIKKIFEKVNDIPYKNDKIVFSEVVKVDGASKLELFLAAREWLVDTYRDAEQVIQMEDKEGGIIIGKGIFSLPPVKRGWFKEFHKCRHSIKIQTKEGRYKVEVYNLKVNDKHYVNEIISDDAMMKAKHRKANEAIKASVFRECEIIKASLKVKMLKAKDSNDDW